MVYFLSTFVGILKASWFNNLDYYHLCWFCCLEFKTYLSPFYNNVQSCNKGWRHITTFTKQIHTNITINLHNLTIKNINATCIISFLCNILKLLFQERSCFSSDQIIAYKQCKVMGFNPTVKVLWVRNLQKDVQY